MAEVIVSEQPSSPSPPVETGGYTVATKRREARRVGGLSRRRSRRTVLALAPFLAIQGCGVARSDAALAAPEQTVSPSNRDERVVAVAMDQSVSVPLETPEPGPPAPSMRVSIEADGFHVDGDPTALDLEGFRAALGARDDAASLHVVIVSSGETSHEQVVQVVDACRRAGVNHFAINVRPEDLR